MKSFFVCFILIKVELIFCCLIIITSEIQPKFITVLKYVKWKDNNWGPFLIFFIKKLMKTIIIYVFTSTIVLEFVIVSQNQKLIFCQIEKGALTLYFVVKDSTKNNYFYLCWCLLHFSGTKFVNKNDK